MERGQNERTHNATTQGHPCVASRNGITTDAQEVEITIKLLRMTRGVNRNIVSGHRVSCGVGRCDHSDLLFIVMAGYGLFHVVLLE